jgi:hypothetical protein
VNIDSHARVYQYGAQLKATIILPAFAARDRLLDYHMAAVQATLDLNEIADPRLFAARLTNAA